MTLPASIVRDGFQVRALLDSAIRVSLAETFPDLDAKAVEHLRADCPEAFDGDVWLATVHSFLVTSGARRVLVDTGIGGSRVMHERYGVGGTLLSQLADIGVAPATVTDVVLTHLHGDHVGGVVDDRDGSPRPVFARAKHYLHDADVRLMRERLVGPRAKVAALFLTAMEQVELEAFTGEHEVLPGVRLLPTPGHTPGSASVVVGKAGGLLLTGDALHHPALIRDPAIRDGHDIDSALSARSRLALMERAVAERRTVGPAHFPSAFIEIGRGSSGWTWRALE